MTRYPTIAGYEVTALLGRGGMATVYAARQLGLDREVAIKVVDLDERDAGQYILRFENEAQSLARLRHPNIVGLYDYGRTAEGLPYYVMPLLDGGDLASRPRPLSEDAVLRLLDVLLGALAHAHEAGIIHRDIKPEN
ncbi:MAG: serine/threonine protein kinase, partial [Xanthomonadales bacterium]|nr:serine/threonine protein kinase [Xanthomonadales bacterium]